MKQLIDFYANKTIRQNEGYQFVKVETVYIPVIHAFLSVTKRDYYGLPLIHEMVLRLINENVHEISEMIGILGVERNLLEVALADMSVQDLIYCTADRCILMNKGRTALKELSTTQRSRECLKNIYLDPINEKIILDYNYFTFLDRVYEDDKKLDANFDSSNINVFKKNKESIQIIFDEEMKIYSDKTKVRASELLSIDEIEKAYPKYVKLSFMVYVSESGYDIDIVALNKRMEGLLSQYKEEIITQIRNRKLLKKIFTKFKLRNYNVQSNYSENNKLVELSRKYCKTDKDSEERYELEQEIEKHIFSNRKLKQMEFEYLLTYLCKIVDKFSIKVNYLDDWCYGNDVLNLVLSSIGTKKLEAVNYSYFNNIVICQNHINKIIDVDREKFKQIANLPYFSLCTSSGWEIKIVPEDILVLDNKTHIYKYEYILEYNSN